MSFDAFNQEVDTESMDSDTINDGGGNTVAAEGRYHVQVESVEIEDAGEKQLPFVKLTMRVLMGEVETEIQKVVYNRIYLANWENKEAGEMGPLKEGALKGLVALFYAFGVIGEEAFGQSALKLSRDMFERLEATQAIIKVTKGNDRTVKDKDGKEITYTGRYEMAWSNDCWPLGHDKVKDVPKDHEAAAVAGAVTGGGDEDLDDI